MLEASQIKAQLAAVADGRLPVWELYDWLDERSIDMHLDSSQEAIDLVGAIDHVFAEYERGVFSKSRLVEKLKALLPRFVVIDLGAEMVRATTVRWGSQLADSGWAAQRV
jgi:hypothetical protein